MQNGSILEMCFFEIALTDLYMVLMFVLWWNGSVKVTCLCIYNPLRKSTKSVKALMGFAGGPAA